jgi:hypothetical protein
MHAQVLEHHHLLCRRTIWWSRPRFRLPLERVAYPHLCLLSFTARLGKHWHIDDDAGLFDRNIATRLDSQDLVGRPDLLRISFVNPGDEV